MLPGHRFDAEAQAAAGPPTSGGVAGDAGPEASSRTRETPSPVWYLWQNWNKRQVSIEAARSSLRFAVIGAGRLGASLALALRHHGLILTGFTAATPAGRARAEEWLAAPATQSVAGLVRARPALYFVCVPDGAVADVAAELGGALAAPQAGSGAGAAGGEAAAAPPQAVPQAVTRPVAQPASRPVVVHTSGATSVAVLAPCEKAGAAALVFHPLQTFPEPLSGASRFAGAGVAITPGPAYPDDAGTAGLQIADLLGLRPFFLADDKRSLYHAAASVACNYLVTLEHLADDLFAKAGVPERVTFELFLPLVRATLDNLAAHGPVRALTGPLSRGDAATIAAHLQALAADAPEALPLYREVGRATLELVAARGEVAPAVIAQMRELLTEPSTRQ
jgi:predicted short-subunit dehydrogenase-like oxidoreductase (DUF2520 family)